MSKLKENHITVSYTCQGEEMVFSQGISIEDLKKIESIVKVDDLSENLTLKDDITISLQTPEQHRESCIQGTMWGDGVSRKVAENIFDDIEMTDDEFEKLNDESEEQTDEQK